MKISDELRQEARELGSYMETLADANEIEAIADRIDAEMVELPHGKDGRPIHVGDTVYDEFPDTLTVNSITLSDCYARVKASGKHAVYDGLDPERLTHERPDSWERIAHDVEKRVFIDEDDENRFRRELADRIRRLAKERGHVS